MSEEKIVILNAIYHALLFLFCLKTSKFQNLSTILSLFYAVGSICSLLFYENPIYYLSISASGKITIEAALLLWFINTCCIMGFRGVQLSSMHRIKKYNGSFLFFVEKLIIIILSIYLCLQLPTSVVNFINSKDLGEMRDMTYSGGVFVAHYSGVVGFVFYRIQQYTYTLPLLLLCILSVRFFLFKEKNVWDLYGLALYILSKLDNILVNISRATMVFLTFEVLIIIIMFWFFMSTSLKSKIIISGIVVGIGMFLIFSAITISRFGKSKEISEDINSLRYAGEANLNFMSLLYPDIKEPFYGYSDFALLRAIIGLDYTTTRDRLDTELYNKKILKNMKYTNPTYIFHGTAGVFVFNFGRIGGALMAFAFFLIFRRICRKKDEISLVTLFGVIIFAANILKGVCYMEIVGYECNYLLIYLIILDLILSKIGTDSEIKRYIQ